jgi:esterase/lipase
VKSVQEIRAPLLVVHSDTDQVNPVDGGRQIFAAAGQPKELAILHGYLSVRKENRVACRFYERHGMTVEAPWLGLEGRFPVAVCKLTDLGD